MGLVVSRAGSADQILHEALEELHRLWRAREVTAATWAVTDHVDGDLNRVLRASWDGAARRAPRHPGRAARPARADPDGRPAGGRRHQARAPGGHRWGSGSSSSLAGRSPPRTGPCSAWSAAISARRCTARTRPISSARRRWPCSARSSGRPGCPPGSPCATSPPPARSRSAATGTTSSNCRTGGSASWSATAWGTTWARPPSWASCAAPAVRCCCRTRGPAQALTAMDRFASVRARSRVRHGVLRHPRPGHRRAHLLQRRLTRRASSSIPTGRSSCSRAARSLPLAIRAEGGPDRGHLRPAAPLDTAAVHRWLGRTPGAGRSPTASPRRARRYASGGGASRRTSPTQVMTQPRPRRGLRGRRGPGALPSSRSARRPVRRRVRTSSPRCGRSCAAGCAAATSARGWPRTCWSRSARPCANAIEHGHRHLPGQQVRLRAVSTADQLRLTVSDTGRWRTSPPGDRSLRGHGISLMRSLMHQVTIVPSPSGTTVDLYLRITHGHSA